MAVHALLRVEKLPEHIWEPAAGRGAISRILTAAGHNVRTTDLVAYPGADQGIQAGVDFLMERQAAPLEWAIVTNPPFKLADEFIRHGLSLGLSVIVLQRLMALEGAARSDIIDGNLVRVWAGIERLPMMHREGWNGRLTPTGGAPFAWFVFSPDKASGSAIELRRMSWRISG